MIAARDICLDECDARRCNWRGLLGTAARTECRVGLRSHHILVNNAQI